MTQKELKKTKSARLYHIIISLTVITLIGTCIYLQNKCGIEFGSLLKSKQPESKMKQVTQKNGPRLLSYPVYRIFTRSLTTFIAARSPAVRA